jgi:hypothetical protein
MGEDLGELPFTLSAGGSERSLILNFRNIASLTEEHFGEKI